MNSLKRSVITALLLSLLLSLTGCIVIPLHGKYDIDKTDLSSVQIYDLRNCETHEYDFMEYDPPLYTVADEQVDDFLKDLSKIRFTDHIIIALMAIDPSFYYGDWVVRLNYTNGTWALLSSDGYSETFDKAGRYISSNHFGCDPKEWEKFVTAYLPAEASQ